MPVVARHCPEFDRRVSFENKNRVGSATVLQLIFNSCSQERRKKKRRCTFQMSLTCETSMEGVGWAA